MRVSRKRQYVTRGYASWDTWTGYPPPMLAKPPGGDGESVRAGGAPCRGSSVCTLSLSLLLERGGVPRGVRGGHDWTKAGHPTPMDTRKRTPGGWVSRAAEAVRRRLIAWVIVLDDGGHVARAIADVISIPLAWLERAHVERLAKQGPIRQTGRVV